MAHNQTEGRRNGAEKEYRGLCVHLTISNIIVDSVIFNNRSIKAVQKRHLGQYISQMCIHNDVAYCDRQRKSWPYFKPRNIFLI